MPFHDRKSAEFTKWKHGQDGGKSPEFAKFKAEQDQQKQQEVRAFNAVSTVFND